ncbi:chemosensory receptor B [Elysia marginata]|uniref:Chemosensory receptor B n=1 Tax=Elysia marginata TaxID=1093978 RepID=A0AAV4FQ11_9GAST|nr:chemosensory receptor B [Elysia marginata]
MVLVQYILTGVSAFGVVSNLINIVVYTKMGFSETSNINFLALSLADLVTVLYMLITALGHIPAVVKLDIPVAPFSVQNIMVPILYPAMAISSWVTALISTERCMCIAYPLKVRSGSRFGSVL